MTIKKCQKKWYPPSGFGGTQWVEVSLSSLRFLSNGWGSPKTPRQLELLRHVHRHPPRSVRALSIALGRDYRRVPEDVEALVNAGLLDRDGTAPRADYDTVRTETSIAL
jgi:predicted transcriptional regulator